MTVLPKRKILVLALASVIPSSLVGQIRASERASVSQTIDGTTITIDYGRPQVRGRTGLFGGEVPWGKIWTPGANWATTIAVSRDIAIDGHELAEGTYSVWFQVQPESWTAIFDPVPHRFHLMPPPLSEDQVRFTIVPEETGHHELLTWSFPAVRPTGADLEFAWGETTVTFDIHVQPSHPVTVAADMAHQYVGHYRLDRRPPLGTGEVQFDINYVDGKLVTSWEGAPNPSLTNAWLVSLGSGMFAAAETRDGKLFDIVMDLIFEFPPTDGPAQAFELRALGDQLWGVGRRIQSP